jgi:hypothetical protein
MPAADMTTPEQEPLLERWGKTYFRLLSRDARIVDIDGVHFLNDEERAALAAVQRGAITRAALAGACSTVIAATTEVLAHPLLGPDPDHAGWEALARFWAIVGGVTVLASILEILFLYWDGLRSVHRLTVVAGLDLFPQAHGTDEKHLVAGAMARAALELPNPTGAIFGVNPRRDASRFRLMMASLVYKLKVSLSSFLTKMFVRRMLGRALVRAWLPFVAVPITAAWNAYVSFLVMREARVRAMGPSAAKELVSSVFEGVPELSPEARAVAVRAVASSIVRTEDMHPNLVALLHEVVARVGQVAESVMDAIDDTRLFLERLGALAQAEQRVALRILMVAAVIDGRITRAERGLLREARRVCGLPEDSGRVESLRRAFVSGDPLPPGILLQSDSGS